MGVLPGFPLQRAAFLMGNDLAGGKVLVMPEVTSIPGRQSPDELASLEVSQGFCSWCCYLIYGSDELEFVTAGLRCGGHTCPWQG